MVAALLAGAIAQRLIDQSQDLGTACRSSDPTHLWFEPRQTGKMVLVVGLSHPLAPRKRARMVELHRQKRVALPRDFARRTMPDECFRPSGAEPVIAAAIRKLVQGQRPDAAGRAEGF